MSSAGDAETGLAHPDLPYQSEFGSVNTNNTVGVSYYDSLQVVFNKRLRRGLEAQRAYTYGHSLDTSIGQLVAADCAGAPGMDIGVSSNTWGTITDHPALTFVTIFVANCPAQRPKIVTVW
jgi:hypothetical protein